MPQIRLEYTDNVDPALPVATLLDGVHRALNSIAGVNLANCKSRVNVVDQFHVAEGSADHGFVHLEVRLLEGRTDAIKNLLGSALLDLLKRSFDIERTERRVQATVEITDIRRNEYFKYPEGTFSPLGTPK